MKVYPELIIKMIFAEPLQKRVAMERIHVQFLLFLTFVSLQVKGNVTCQKNDALETGGKCYHFDSTALSYSEAKRACELKEGVLAKVTEQDVVTYLLRNLDTSFAWIGANLNSEGYWVWEDSGDNATELNQLWGPDEPSNTSGNEHCAGITYISGETGTVKEVAATDCNGTHDFLCMEKDLPTATEPVTSDSETTNIGASTSTSKVPLTTLMKCGAKSPSFNVLLFLNLFAFTYLFI